ncbi:MAG: alanine racemase [Lentisphaeria bacterium]|nr:alanine racemase [Lentisphaeria bacterium]
MQKAFPGLRLAPVIKSDAYGHGIIHSARALEEVKTPYICVFAADEAKILRDAGITTRIIILGGALDLSECDTIASLDNVAVSAWNLPEIRELSRCAVARKRVVELHLKVDTGMSRLGFFPEECPAVVEEILSLPGLSLKGAFTHLASADHPEKDYTERQTAAFKKAIASLPAGATEIHQSATPGMLAGVGLEYPIVRPGFTLYGYGDDPRMPDVAFEPVMEFRSHLISLKEIPVGAEISYGGIYRVEDRPRKIAVVPVGYSDGYPRLLGNQADVLVRGRRAPIRGRVCMGMFMVDVTEIPDAAVGDEVVLLGCQGDECINANELATKVGTIPYELLCSLGKHPNRVFK